MKDINEIRLSGTIDRAQEPPIKTGTRMVKLLLQVRRNKFRIIVFKDVAGSILNQYSRGSRLSVTGTGGIHSRKEDQGTNVNR